MRAISLPERLSILADCDAGLRTGLVAEKHGVSGTFVRNLKQERRLTGALREPRQRGPGQRPKIDRARLAALVEADADATLTELRERLGISCSLAALWYVLHDLRITFKKKRSAPRSRTVRMSPSGEVCGGPGRSGSTRAASSSSMKPGPRPT